VNPVIQQHKIVLGQNSNPCRQLLLDLANVILTLRQKGDEFILAMDANEEPPQQMNIVWNDFEMFCATTGLMDAMTALHGYATIPSCSRSSYKSSPIDFFYAHPLFSVGSGSVCWMSCRVAHSYWIWIQLVYGSSPSRLLHCACQGASIHQTIPAPRLKSTSYMSCSSKPTFNTPSKRLKMRLTRNHRKRS